MQSKFQDYSHLKGETFRGKIVDTGGSDESPDPVAIMDEEIPNCVVKNLDPSDAEYGRRVKVMIQDTTPKVIFGEIVDRDNKPVEDSKKEEDTGKSYVVEYEMFGYTFQSETLDTEAAANDLADFLSSKVEKEVNVERKR